MCSHPVLPSLLLLPCHLMQSPPICHNHPTCEPSGMPGCSHPHTSYHHHYMCKFFFVSFFILFTILTPPYKQQCMCSHPVLPLLLLSLCHLMQPPPIHCNCPTCEPSGTPGCSCPHTSYHHCYTCKFSLFLFSFYLLFLPLHTSNNVHAAAQCCHHHCHHPVTSHSHLLSIVITPLTNHQAHLAAATLALATIIATPVSFLCFFFHFIYYSCPSIPATMHMQPPSAAITAAIGLSPCTATCCPS
jgi:hypothetical protein